MNKDTDTKKPADGDKSALNNLVSRLTIAGILLESTGDEPWKLQQRRWVCHMFKVVGPKNVTRTDIANMVGKQLYGKEIRGIESCAVENQMNKKISIAIDD